MPRYHAKSNPEDPHLTVQVPFTPEEEAERDAEEAAWAAGVTARALAIPISYETFQDRFTSAEFNAATDFIYENDIITGKPKRRALIQRLSRAIAKNQVRLDDARTVAFLDALVTGGVITAQRKAEILTP